MAEHVIHLRLPRPNEKQKRFLECQKKYIAFGGARGGGKSWAVRIKAILLALNYAGIRLLIVRRTCQELENNHIRQLRVIGHDCPRIAEGTEIFGRIKRKAAHISEGSRHLSPVFRPV